MPPAPLQTASATKSRRMENTVVCLPIVYGSVAFYLGKRSDEFQTHQWTLYVRGSNAEDDLSHCISKVVFQLHASFAQPMRELHEPPYEVTERGWGEFEAQVRIFWKDTTEKTTMVVHPIKLYPLGSPPNTVQTDTETPVVAENYDEIVFTNPTELFFNQLQKVGCGGAAIQYSQQQHFTQFSDTDDAHLLLEAQKFLQTELTAVKQRLGVVDGELASVDVAVREAHHEKSRSAASTAVPTGSTSRVHAPSKQQATKPAKSSVVPKALTTPKAASMNAKPAPTVVAPLMPTSTSNKKAKTG